jgi:very-short-patch-repair endonuclease
MMGYDFDRQRPMGNYIVDFYCKDLQLALDADGITHEDEKVMQKDEIRQEELEMYGVSFLRFDSMLVVNKVKAAVREIRQLILEYEEKKGGKEFVKRKRDGLMNPGSKKR